jgi:hypothetical protein
MDTSEPCSWCTSTSQKTDSQEREIEELTLENKNLKRMNKNLKDLERDLRNLLVKRLMPEEA